MEWLKQSLPPETVIAFLVSRGAGDHEARQTVAELCEQKRRADALDPKRLREEAKWMLWRGATVDHVVAHFVSLGIAEEPARAEAEKIFVAVQRMRPCERCTSPVAPGESFFDPAGRQVCKRCHSLDEIGAGDRRVTLGALEMVGVPSWAVQSVAGPVQHSYAPAQRPWCARCHSPSGVHVNALHPSHRAQVHPGWIYVCGWCFTGLA